MKSMRTLLKDRDPTLLLLLEIWEDKTGQRLVSMVHSIMVAKTFAFITCIMFAIFVGLAFLSPLQNIFSVQRDSVSITYVVGALIYLLINLLCFIAWKKEEWSVRDRVFGKKEGLEDFFRTVSLLEDNLGKVSQKNYSWPRSLEEAAHLERLRKTAEEILSLKAAHIKWLQLNPAYNDRAEEKRKDFSKCARNFSVLTGSSMDYGPYFARKSKRK